jgi:hypothetical protein
MAARAVRFVTGSGKVRIHSRLCNACVVCTGGARRSDHAVGTQPLEFGRVDSDARQHFGSMLAQDGRAHL